MSLAYSYDFAKDPCGVGRAFERATEVIKSKFTAEERAQPDFLKDSEKRSHTRMMAFLPLIDSRIFGRLLADFLSDPQNIASMNGQTEFDPARCYQYLQPHHLQPSELEKTEKLFAEVPTLIRAFKILDKVAQGYGEIMSAYAHTIHKPKRGETSDHINITKGLFILANKIQVVTTDRVRPFETEFSVFYVSKLTEIAGDTMFSGSEVIYPSDPGVYAAALKKTLTEPPLRHTFLSCEENHFTKCPFHAITSFFMIGLREEGGRVVYDREVSTAGALLPFMIQRIQQADRTPRPSRAGELSVVEPVTII